jgi:type III secretory pathway component EscS
MDSGDLSLAIDLGRAALWVAVKLSFPILLSALVVGAPSGVVQAATQLQDQTLNQVPKMFTVARWCSSCSLDPGGSEYTHELVRDMGMWFR